MKINSFFKDGYNKTPKAEILHAARRTPSSKYHKGGSMKGRLFCAALAPAHLLNIAAKPIFYCGATSYYALKTVVKGGLYCAGKTSIIHMNYSELSDLKKERNKSFKNTFGCAANIPASIPGQVMQAAKAAAGVFHPGAYFKSEAATQPADGQFNHPNSIHPRNLGDRPNRNQSAGPKADHLTENNPAGFGAFKGDKYEITCNQEWPFESPEEALQVLADGIKEAQRKGADFKLCIVYNKQNGEDTGGLSRQFITDLFASLSRELGLHEGIAQWSERNDPVYRNIGIVMGMILKTVDDNLLLEFTNAIQIGEVFAPRYFQMVNFQKDELDGSFEDLHLERILDMLLASSEGLQHEFFSNVKRLIDDSSRMREHERDELITYLEDLLSFNPNEIMFTPSGRLTDDSKNHILESLKEDYGNAVQTLFTIAQGMCAGVTKRQWDLWTATGDEAVRRHIQGEFDRNLLFNRDGRMDKLRFTGIPQFGQLILNDNWNPEDFFPEEKRRAILDRLQSKTDDELKNFLEFTTASRVVPLDSITFNIGNFPKMMAHSCTFTIDIPENMSIRQILERLDEFCVGEIMDFAEK